jgi:hypothetical protein
MAEPAKTKKKVTKKKSAAKGKSKKPDTVKFKYLFADDYNPVYANGAYGGITTKGEMVINFFLERTGLPYSETFELKEGSEIGVMVERNPEHAPPNIVRFVSTGVVLSYESAKTIRDWLDKHLAQLEKLQGKDDEH